MSSVELCITAYHTRVNNLLTWYGTYMVPPLFFFIRFCAYISIFI